MLKNSRIHLYIILLQLCTFNLCFGYGSQNIFKKFPNKYFIESGSFVGEGIQQALDTNSFQIIHSIELSPDYYKLVKNKFHNNHNVILWEGDSGSVIRNILNFIDEPATFWLDGHYSGNYSVGNTALGQTYSPLMQELECIYEHPIKNHVILIDDVRQFGTIVFDFITLETITRKLMEINPNYTIEFLDCPCQARDVLAAYIK